MNFKEDFSFIWTTGTKVVST